MLTGMYEHTFPEMTHCYRRFVLAEAAINIAVCPVSVRVICQSMPYIFPISSRWDLLIPVDYVLCVPRGHMIVNFPRGRIIPHYSQILIEWFTRWGVLHAVFRMAVADSRKVTYRVPHIDVGSFCLGAWAVGRLRKWTPVAEFTRRISKVSAEAKQKKAITVLRDTEPGSIDQLGKQQISCSLDRKS